MSPSYKNEKKISSSIRELRKNIDAWNEIFVELLNRRLSWVRDIAQWKAEHRQPIRDLQREEALKREIQRTNRGPFRTVYLQQILESIIENSLKSLNLWKSIPPKVDALPQKSKWFWDGLELDFSKPFYIAGPCAVESASQIEKVAQILSKCGVPVLRGGAWKPRSSPYAFQGHGLRALKWLREAAHKYGLIAVSEIMSIPQLEQALPYVDMVQVGSRNMHHYELLKALGKISKPVLLKRGFGSTLEEWLFAAEYIAESGNSKILMCERGIRTFEDQTRATLDLGSLALLKAHTSLPIVADISHAAGRRDILPALARASFALGVHAVMIEVHPDPDQALSDPLQQWPLHDFCLFKRKVQEQLQQISQRLF